MIASLAAAGILSLSTLGLGSGVLALLGIWRARRQLERTALAFAVGLGVLGWLFFWIGISGGLTPFVSWSVSGLSLIGLTAYRLPAAPEPSPGALSPADWILIALAAVAFGADFLEALAPPVDADSLAYHFDLARRFAENGGIFFVPRALDGAVPLLIQVTYAAAYSMGGEKALTLWTLISGWGASILLFALCCRWFGQTWALALALLFQTVPAMIYGAGSGQVEARLALFVLVSTYGLIEMRRMEGWAPAVLVGLGAGFYAASKYTGLLFLAAAGIALLLVAKRKWFALGAACGIAALVAGGQWYAWNFIHTGDPVFPVLFNALGLPDGPYWDAGYAADMKALLTVRYNQISWWQRWLAYPIVATFSPPVAIEAGRVGLGPFFALTAPIALLGFWLHRRRAWQSPLGPVALLSIIFYFLWLKFGGIPKVRHLVPVLPAVLLCFGVAISRYDRPWARRPVYLATAIALAVNFAAVVLFARPFAQFAFSPMTRDAFLAASVNDYEAVEWLNRQPGVHKVLALQRQYLYYVDAPTYFAYPNVQKQVEARAGKVRPAEFLSQIRQLGITNILGQTLPENQIAPKTVLGSIGELEEEGCLAETKRFSTTWHVSRTLPQFGTNSRETAIWKLTPDSCRASKAGEPKNQP